MTVTNSRFNIIKTHLPESTVNPSQSMKKDNQQHQPMEEEMMQQIRSKATELLLREEWNESIQHYSHFISLSQRSLSNTHDPGHITKIQKSLCLAFSNRAEAKSRLKEYSEAISDCDLALKIENAHFKTLLCKGKILLNLNRYSDASKCFKLAQSDIQNNGNSETLNGYLDLCKKLEIQSKTGIFDLSDWVLNGFREKPPELAEYIGSVQIKKSELSGRGLFATKNMEAGSVFLVTKAIAIGRGLLPEPDDNLAESARLVMWKDFIDKVSNSARKCCKIQSWISMLSMGEDEESLQIPDISLFRPETSENVSAKEKLEMSKIASILDVNAITEDGVSAKVLGKNSDYYGIGLWMLVSFINHSCIPNARRLHIGDYVIVHTSRDVKAGEEITLAYFNVLLPWRKRKEMSTPWGFQCNCKRCRFEEVFACREELREVELAIEFGSDMGGVLFKLEERMRRWMIKSKEKSYLRASFWGVFVEAFKSDKCMRRWGRRIPNVDVIVESLAEVVGGDERVLKVLVERLKRIGNGEVLEMEKAVKLGKGVYGKVVKKQAMKALLELCIHSW